jgi:hypothetical protein
MMGHFMKRTTILDAAFLSGCLEDRLKSRAETLRLVREEPGRLQQTRADSLASDCKRIGLYSYALGHPLDEVRLAFSEASEALVRVFALRGTEESFPVMILAVDPTKSEDDPAFVIGDRPLHPPGSKDYSLTNSRDCFNSICVASIAGEHSNAEKLAALMWDPPKASYIGPRSEVCTPNQQHLAYAVKHLLQDQPEELQQELKQVRYRKQEEQITFLAKMVRGQAENNDAFFLEGLQQLLYWHQTQVKHPSNKFNPEMFFCIPAVALSILAVRRGLVRKVQLPEDPYLPLELIPED